MHEALVCIIQDSALRGQNAEQMLLFLRSGSGKEENSWDFYSFIFGVCNTFIYLKLQEIGK